MSYKFKLQKVLDVKERAEDNKKNEVYTINVQLIEATNDLSYLNNEFYQKGIEREEKNKGGTSVIEIRQLNEYIKYLQHQIELKKQEIESIKGKLEKKKQEYMESRKERKSFEILKEKDYDRYMAKEAKEEEKIIDEIVSFSSRKI